MASPQQNKEQGSLGKIQKEPLYEFAISKIFND